MAQYYLLVLSIARSKTRLLIIMKMAEHCDDMKWLGGHGRARAPMARPGTGHAGGGHAGGALNCRGARSGHRHLRRRLATKGPQPSFTDRARKDASP